MTAALAEPKIVPPGHGALGIDGLALKARVRGILNRHPAVGLAVGVVRNGRLEFFYGHGLADIASNTPVSEDTVFRIGSITKTFTAIAVLQLWEQGLVDLDVPANDYLRAYRLVPAKAAHRPATVRQLLTHTAGLPQLVYPSRAFRPILGETVRFGQRLPTLAEFYRGGLHLVAEPGTRHTYSNHGFATLGQIVEDVSGEPLDRYFREHIFEPLGMADTDLLRSERVRSRLATGYALRSDGPHPVSDCDVVTVGAGSIYSTTSDMARYVSALLGGGANEHGSVLKPETLASMFAPHYQPDPRLPGVGLAFFRGEVGGHLVVEHDGLVPGFSSQMSVAPDDGVGVVAFTNGARSAKAWLGAEAAGTMSYLLGVPDDAIRTDVPHHPEIWRDICGWYSFCGSFRDVQKWFVVGAEVSAHRGQLMLRVLSPIPALNRGLPLHPDDHQDPYVFRIDLSKFGIGTSRVVFSRAPGVGTTAVHLGFAPLSFQRQPRTRNPRRWPPARSVRLRRPPRRRPHGGVAGGDGEDDAHLDRPADRVGPADAASQYGLATGHRCPRTPERNQPARTERPPPDRGRTRGDRIQAAAGPPVPAGRLRSAARAWRTAVGGRSVLRPQRPPPRASAFRR
jgi:CubicO group peptidase (beta-lactamase class C family)